MIAKLRISEANAVAEFDMACQRLLPGIRVVGEPAEPPFGVMACFLPPRSRSAPDCHDQDEVMIVLSGSGAVDIAGEHGEITEGELVSIPRNAEHVVHNTSGATLSWVSFYWPLHEPVTDGQA